ncbi:MAG: carboxypeptidase regulatory-like domain-containing protein [Spirochaetales bacterium]|nr:carboxypeptidase regulatory-like domain-containing protein [Spirochaetales bacterium]
MNKPNKLTVALIAGGAVTIVLIIVLVFIFTAETTCSFVIEDAVSGSGVWDSTITLQNRVIKGYHRTHFTFTHLKPGKAELKISAPNYLPQSIDVDLGFGSNVIDESVRMEGIRIPGIDRFYIFEQMQGEKLILDLRPATKEKQAVVNHPCLDIRVILRISRQTAGGGRGELLFTGVAPWQWNPDAAATYKYSASIPRKDIPNEPYPWVIDYLIIVPDPLKIKAEELDKIITGMSRLTKETEIREHLDKYRDEFSYYISSNHDITFTEN